MIPGQDSLIGSTEFAVGLEPTWVGHGRKAGEICVASEGGQLLFVDTTRVSQGGIPVPMDEFATQETSAKPARAKTDGTSVLLEGSQTINAAGFIRDRAVVTTRSAIQIMLGNDLATVTHRTDYGAHGIATRGIDSFAAPAGQDGLFCMRLLPGKVYGFKTISDLDESLYFYRTALLGRDPQGLDWYASACRDGGFVVTPIGIKNGGTTMSTFEALAEHGTQERDVVDVCALNIQKYPFGAAFLTSNGAIHISRDVRLPEAEVGSQEIELDDEMPYAIHIARGHVFVTTDRGLHIFQNMAHHLVSSSPAGKSSDMYFIENEIVWSTVLNDYLYLVGDMSVQMLRVAQFDSNENTIPEATPTFQWGSDSMQSQFRGNRITRDEKLGYRATKHNSRNSRYVAV